MIRRLFHRATEIAEAAAASTVLDPPTIVTETSPGRVSEAVRRDGTVSIRLISPGMGSSGWYSPEVLERAARDQVFAAGTHMYLDHPGAAENIDRPERSLRDLVGVLATDARWVPDHPDGPGLYAEATVYGPWRDVIAEMAPDIGVSIRAAAEVATGQMNGQNTRIVERILEARSVDYVTRAGRGGRVLELLEAAREATVGEARNWLGWFESRIHLSFTERADDAYGEGRITKAERLALSAGIGAALDAFSAHVEQAAPGLLTRDLWDEPSPPAPNPVTESEEDDMTPEQIREAVAEAVQAETADLRESITTLTSERDELATGNARLAEALLVRDVRDLVTDQVNAVEGLPAPTRARLIGQLQSNPPLAEDGSIDTETLTARVDEAVTAELTYLAEATGSPVRGVGAATQATTATADELAERRAKAFERLGLSETAAKIAAEGR